ncbi:valine--tRNA ligase [Planctomycetales bacterium]|nr:valine--tRNA ligase [Planctomycetales bacterium]GHT00490.1 valine--tRNA ligase [Planctomycetales bacterium]GHT03239.1 valine--tRNA ligase [Planctomycetales bacterium]GHV19882.1 valine--tRNA ligase [Planctomycetales bacterium]
MSDDQPTDLPKHYSAADAEAKWYARWEAAGGFNSDVDKNRLPYTVVIPPPNVTGKLHMGHALNNTLQDILIRVERMRGKNALWQPGTDHAGIATQNVVERQLRQDGFHREDIGREKFIEKVWQWKEQYGSTIINQLKKLGSSCDWRRERFTMDDGLARAVRVAFVQLYRDGLIYRGRKLINWCPKDRTALADDEVDKIEEAGHLWYLRYPVKNPKRADRQYLVVATTRPETMLGDTAVAVNPADERYQDLIGQTVILPLTGREIPVIGDAFVEMKFGSGCVKVTPAHDLTDYECGLRHQLEQIVVIGEDGLMTDKAGKFRGLDRFRCREKIVAELDEKHLLDQTEDLTHSVGHCYRCGTAIEPYLSEQWFVSMKPLAEKAIAASQAGEVKFYPARWEKVYLNWLTEVRDWCISRQIWWGHRLPVWYCEKCGETHVAETAPAECAKCGAAELRQETDVLDTWFSSALWPFSTLGWPDDTEDLRYYYPTDTLVTDRGIIYFWVARMVMLGLQFMKEVPFKSVYIHGSILDENGAKMSKSKGNGIDPLVMIDGGTQTRFGKEVTFPAYGADVVRYTLCALTTEGQDIKLQPTKFDHARNFVNKVWNVSRFVMLSLSGKTLTTAPVEVRQCGFADRWILSRLQAVVEQANAAFDRLAFSEFSTVLYDFIWRDFCDWYVEMVKPAFREATPESTNSARVLLYTLDRILRLLHPITPFFTEEVWSRLRELAPSRGLTDSLPAGEFLMKEKWTQPVAEWRDEELEISITEVQDLVRAVRNIRAKYRAPDDKPVELHISAAEGNAKLVDRMANFLTIIQARANVGKIFVGVDLLKPKVAATEVLAGAQIFVPLAGLLDVETERQRAEKELEKKKKALYSLNQKLHNFEFLKNAPPAIVANEKERAADLEQQVKNLQAWRDGLQ